MDVANLYTGGWDSAGVRWHHNWVHDGSEKCLRGDDQSANMSVHHNVIFNCGAGAEMDVGSASSSKGMAIWCTLTLYLDPITPRSVCPHACHPLRNSVRSTPSRNRTRSRKYSTLSPSVIWG